MSVIDIIGWTICAILYSWLFMLVYQIMKHDWVELTRNPLKIRIFDTRRVKDDKKNAT